MGILVKWNGIVNDKEFISSLSSKVNVTTLNSNPGSEYYRFETTCASTHDVDRVLSQLWPSSSLRFSQVYEAYLEYLNSSNSTIDLNQYIADVARRKIQLSDEQAYLKQDIDILYDERFTDNQLKITVN